MAHAPNGSAKEDEEAGNNIQNPLGDDSKGLAISVPNEGEGVPDTNAHLHRHMKSIFRMGGPRAVGQAIRTRVPVHPWEVVTLTTAGTYGSTVFIRAAVDLAQGTDDSSKFAGIPATFWLITVWFALKETRNNSPGWKRYSAYAAATCTGLGFLLNILKSTGVLDKDSVWPDLFMSLGTLILPLVFWPPKTNRPTRSGKIGQRVCISLGAGTSLLMVATVVAQLAGNRVPVVVNMNKLANPLTSFLFAGNGAFESVRKVNWPWWKQTTDLAGFGFSLASLIVQALTITGAASIPKPIINMVTNLTVPAWALGMIIATMKHIAEPVTEGSRSTRQRQTYQNVGLQSPPTPHEVQGWGGWFLGVLDHICFCCCPRRRARARTRIGTEAVGHAFPAGSPGSPAPFGSPGLRQRLLAGTEADAGTDTGSPASRRSPASDSSRSSSASPALRPLPGQFLSPTGLYPVTPKASQSNGAGNEEDVAAPEANYDAM